MKNTIKNFAIIMILSIFFVPTLTIKTYASSSSVLTTPIETVSNTQTDNNYANINGLENEIMPNTPIEVVQDRITKKGNEVVDLIQRIAKPISEAVFCISAFVSVFGIFGRSGAVMKGLIGMALSVVVYTSILFAPEILQWGSMWLSH